MDSDEKLCGDFQRTCISSDGSGDPGTVNTMKGVRDSDILTTRGRGRARTKGRGRGRGRGRGCAVFN